MHSASLCILFYEIQKACNLFYTGGFDLGQVAVGSISCLNIWSSVYQKDQLVDFADCKQEGDVFTMKPGALAIHGTITSEIKPVLNEPKESGKLLMQYLNIIIFVTHVFCLGF